MGTENTAYSLRQYVNGLFTSDIFVFEQARLYTFWILKWIFHEKFNVLMHRSLCGRERMLNFLQTRPRTIELSRDKVIILFDMLKIHMHLYCDRLKNRRWLIDSWWEGQLPGFSNSISEPRIHFLLEPVRYLIVILTEKFIRTILFIHRSVHARVALNL